MINEPYFHMSKPVVDKLNADVLAIIRELQPPNRMVTLTGGGAKSYKTPAQLDPDVFKDPYLIAWFHYYLPFSFTK